MRRGCHHAPRVARGAHAAPLAGKRDEDVSSSVFGPANLPAAVVHTLNAAIGRAVASPEFTARFATIVREAGIRLD
jgi:hypothetical protein